MDTRDISSLIKEKRLEKQLTQKQLAKLLHVSTAAVSKWERGLNRPDIQNMKPLSKILDIPLTELLPNDMLIFFLESDSDTAGPNADDAPESVVSAADDHISPEPKTSSLSDRAKKKAGWKAIVASLLCVLLLGTAATVCWLKLSDKAPSFTVVDEYYDDYEGQKAYYLLVEYTGEPTNDDYDKADFSIQQTYSDLRGDAAFIIIIYYGKGHYDNSALDPFASASSYTFLYPRPLLETPEGVDSL